MRTTVTVGVRVFVDDEDSVAETVEKLTAASKAGLSDAGLSGTVRVEKVWTDENDETVKTRKDERVYKGFEAETVADFGDLG